MHVLLTLGRRCWTLGLAEWRREGTGLGGLSRPVMSCFPWSRAVCGGAEVKHGAWQPHSILGPADHSFIGLFSSAGNQEWKLPSPWEPRGESTTSAPSQEELIHPSSQAEPSTSVQMSDVRFGSRHTPRLCKLRLESLGRPQTPGLTWPCSSRTCLVPALCIF